MKLPGIALVLALLIHVTHAQAPATDPFATGSVWTGERRFEKDNGKLRKRSQSWSLTITDRNGREFKGTITIESNLEGKNVTYEVSGNAPFDGDGPINFKTERSGDFQQTFIGKVKNGGVILDFRGKNAAGETIDGVAALTRKN